MIHIAPTVEYITSLDGYAIALGQCVETTDVLDIEAGIYRSLAYALRTNRMRPGRNPFYANAIRMCEARRRDLAIRPVAGNAQSVAGE